MLYYPAGQQATTCTSLVGDVSFSCVRKQSYNGLLLSAPALGQKKSLLARTKCPSWRHWIWCAALNHSCFPLLMACLLLTLSPTQNTIPCLSHKPLSSPPFSDLCKAVENGCLLSASTYSCWPDRKACSRDLRHICDTQPLPHHHTKLKIWLLYILKMLKKIPM